MDKIKEKKTKDEYNNERVEYCKTCGSLYILDIEGEHHGYCGECFGRNTGWASIQWIENWYKKIGKRFYKPTRIKI